MNLFRVGHRLAPSAEVEEEIDRLARLCDHCDLAAANMHSPEGLQPDDLVHLRDELRDPLEVIEFESVAEMLRKQGEGV